MTPTLSSIRVYPVKSLAGTDLAEARVDLWGLGHDRRWLLSTPERDVLTARQVPGMLHLHASPLEDGGIVLSAGDGSAQHVPPPLHGELIATALSRLDTVRWAGSEADGWLSRHLDRPVRLGWLDEPGRRSVSEHHGGRPGDPLSLADAGPLLLTSQASLRRLNEWMMEDAAARGEDPPPAIAMTRFRPNVVVEHVDEPFAEDRWLGLRIGSVELRFAEHCDRCFLTTFDPDTLARGKEPLRTLAQHRRWDHKTWFGIRLIPVSTGKIQLGDAVTLLAEAVP